MDSAKVHALLIGVGFLIFLGAQLYYSPRYDIGNSHAFYKGKLSQKNILIKLKLFKYNDNCNWFLLVPYLLAWNLFIATFIVYIVYWCGVQQLAVFFTSKLVGVFLIGLVFSYFLYEGVLNMIYLSSGNHVVNQLDFKVENKENEKDMKNK